MVEWSSKISKFFFAPPNPISVLSSHPSMCSPGQRSKDVCALLALGNARKSQKATGRIRFGFRIALLPMHNFIASQSANFAINYILALPNIHPTSFKLVRRVCFSFGGTVPYIEESNIYLCFVVCRLKRGLVT